jgi:hypothetical protein
MTQAFNLSQLANRCNSSGQINTTAVQSGTYPINISGTSASATSATTATTAGSAGQLSTGNYSVFESGGFLYFRFSSTNIARLDSSGNLIVTGSVQAYGSI